MDKVIIAVLNSIFSIAYVPLTYHSFDARWIFLIQWHPTVSAKDEKWTEDFFAKAFNGKPAADVRFSLWLRISMCANLFILSSLWRTWDRLAHFLLVYQRIPKCAISQRKLTLSSVKQTPYTPASYSSLKRGLDGRFNDADLFSVLADATESPASSFGGQNSPGVLRLVEIMGMEQARSWGVCTMNEFRQFLGLKRTWSPQTASFSVAVNAYSYFT